MFLSIYLAAQDSLKITKESKFGLVLSGGGAKGFAHIGILKMIDSLGIKIDYITGTSMGGILGGLYAMGYSGEDLKNVVYNTNWKRVLSNTIPYNKINISEKDEYGKYVVELPVSRGIPSLPSSLIEGQYMSEVLSTLAFRANHINDFSKLSIPVELTSSDIINGGLVMQKKGSLALAIRATLAIPAVFAPVYIGDELFVDGGLDRNFPVKELKDMGADYIIGGYAGFRLFTKKEVENPIKMIYQTHAFRSVQDYSYQKKMTDLLIDFVKPLNNYTTKDFKHYKKIIKIGEREAENNLQKFLELAKKQKDLGISSNHRMIDEIKKPTVGFTYKEENGTALESSEIVAIRNLMNLKEGEYYDVKKVNESIDKIFGMRRYEKVYYTYTDTNEGLIMNIFVKKIRQSVLKMALHYDNEQSVGIVVNFTYRNIPKKFRSVATIDISERFKGRFQFQKFLDDEFRFWINTEAMISNTKSNDFILRVINELDDDSATVETYGYNNIFTNINASVNYNLNNNICSSLGIEYSRDKVNRSFDRVYQGLLRSNDKSVFNNNNINLFFKLNQNSLNERYYPSSGNQLQIISKYYLGGHYNLYNLEDTNTSLFNYLNPRNDNYFIPENLLSLAISENFFLPINKRLSLGSSIFLGTYFSSNNDPEKSPYLFFNQKYNIGGTEYHFGLSNSTFNGFRQNELPVNSFFKLGVDVQYNWYENFYVTPSFHFGSVSSELFPFNENEILYGYGAGIGWKSIIGPINLTISKNNFFDFWRAYLSIGFKF
ncbi:NTE family protein [Chryseobacterium culicis]|uniref:NTE family protein n=2 Tax=Chryseobacterium culicis TaxID=680127 RepID=A0A1H6IS85_CHRCI|nr:NTE family protein [Chryseobacterium culicis]